MSECKLLSAERLGIFQEFCTQYKGDQWLGIKPDAVQELLDHITALKAENEAKDKLLTDMSNWAGNQFARAEAAEAELERIKGRLTLGTLLRIVRVIVDDKDAPYIAAAIISHITKE
jgi:hypothetical protein